MMMESSIERGSIRDVATGSSVTSDAEARV